jgi:hypothetical protein
MPEANVATGLVLSAAELGRLHTDLEKRLGAVLSYAVTIRPSNTVGDWRAAREGNVITFALIVTEGSGIASRALRNIGSAAGPVLQLPTKDDYGNAAWAGWQERWFSLGRQERFGLARASWTFHWGPDQRSDKEQLFRAEWDQNAYSKEADKSGAAQPHWHFDRALLPPIRADRPMPSAAVTLGGGLEELPQARPALEELTPSGPGDSELLQSVNVAGLHLGMAGWTHAQDHPQCWQSQVQARAELVVWAASTLRYVKDEFALLKAGRPEEV